MIGKTISHYRITEKLGQGGMGEVFLAEDIRLNRKVAIKLLPSSISQDPNAKARFLREAQAESSVDHPNIATIYEIGDWEQQFFIAMAYYEGQTLKQRLTYGAMEVGVATSVLLQIANGLLAAHRASIVHRDLKPANIMITRDGQVKILDFGLAKVLRDTADESTALTTHGMLVGTVAYMAPEQARGEGTDARADIWALGVIAYEMFGGQPPFKGDSTTAILLAVQSETPIALSKLKHDVPVEVSDIIDQALEKSWDRRTLTAENIVQRLSAYQSVVAHLGGAVLTESSGRKVGYWWLAIAAIICFVAVVVLGWYLSQDLRARRARERTLPEIEKLVEQEQYFSAFRMANEVRPEIPADPVWNRLDPLLSRVASVTTAPPGANVYYREYGSSEKEWTYVGKSPLTDLKMPNAFLIWKVEKEGFHSTEDATGQYPTVTVARPKLNYILHEPQTVPPGMVYVTTDNARFKPLIPGLDHLPAVTLHDFWIDRYEVTNREFKAFVDAGGYRNPAFWRHSFVHEDQTLTFDQAIALMTDVTGRTGPATWESGGYPGGQDDFPVRGINWYEAEAYATWAGKSLPTIYHWSRVADQAAAAFIVPHSNFGGKGPSKVGASGGMNRFGAYDMAGNVKEWCWNSSDRSRRYILGGAWDEPVYMFNDPDSQPPFDRRATYGFRCVKYSSDESLVSASTEMVPLLTRDYKKEKPVGDAIFDAYRRMYAYDKTGLEATIDSVDDRNPDWRRENVSFTAGYGNERLPAALLVPRTGHPPYQTVVVFPGSGALQMRSSGQMDIQRFEWIMKSGRVAIQPIYKSTFERGDDLQSDYPNRTALYRDHVIAWAKEVSRTIDYLETHKDIATDQIAYIGFSWGAALGPIFVAAEPRFKACILVMGGFFQQSALPEADALNFAPRVKAPVLLLSGRYDFFFPTETAQLPMFRLFGVPEDQKRRVEYETGHMIPRIEQIRESLNWLDRYLGPVR